MNHRVFHLLGPQLPPALPQLSLPLAPCRNFEGKAAAIPCVPGGLSDTSLAASGSRQVQTVEESIPQEEELLPGAVKPPEQAQCPGSCQHCHLGASGTGTLPMLSPDLSLENQQPELLGSSPASSSAEPCRDFPLH